MQGKSNLGKKLLSGILVGGLLLTGSMALADTKNASDQTNTAQADMKGPGSRGGGPGEFGGHGGLGGRGGLGGPGGYGALFDQEWAQNVFDQLVENDVLTSDQVDNCRLSLKKSRKSSRPKVMHSKI
jgi:hypothetical protein